VSLLRTAVLLTICVTVAVFGYFPHEFGPLVFAAAYTVNSTEDLPDGSPGDGACETARGSGVCTLRAAIMEANAQSGADTIVVPAGLYRLGRPPEADDDFAVYGDLDIINNLTITGASPTDSIIDGAGTSRIFDIATPVSVSMSKLTLRSGAEGDGAGIRNAGSLTLTDVTVAGNTAQASGGGILNTGTLSMSGGALSGNHSGRGGALTNLGTVTLNGTAMDGNSVWRYGGALTNDPSSFMTLTNVTVTNNSGGFCCGGIANGGTLTITGSTISKNRSEFGGGLTNNHRNAAANIGASTISENSADDGGGGIVNQGTLTATNVTLSANKAGANGGGLYNGFFDGAPSSTSLINVTLAGNSAPNGSAVFNDTRAGVQLRNTLIAAGTGGGSCAGPMTSLGHNLDEGASCGLSAAGDIASTGAKLGPLADNGGPTRTHTPLPDSPAIDAGDAANCPSADQRGIARPQRSACDIGAVEVAGPGPGTSKWAERPPTSAQMPGICPQTGVWLLLYWAGNDGAAIAAEAGGCPTADFYWVNRQGAWLGFAATAPSASDTWTLLRGEAHFVHGR
jgi:CSLREA domain-containing protein